MTRQPLLSVVIPASNQAEILPLTLLEVDKYLSDESYPAEILVIDYGSQDYTPRIVESLQKAIKKLRLIQDTATERNEAIKQGMLLSRGRYRLLFEPDHSFPINNLAKILPLLKAKEVVIGRREPVKDELMFARWRRKIMSALLRFICGSEISDLQSTFQAWSAEAAEDIFNIIPPGQAISFVSLVLAERRGYHCLGAPVLSRSRANRQARFSDLQLLLKALTIRLRLFGRGLPSHSSHYD